MPSTAIQNEFGNTFQALNDFIEDRNQAARQEGSPVIPKQVIRIVGQTALLLADLPFAVTGTMDLDVISSLDFSVQKKLSELLLDMGMRLESDGQLIWMPGSTEYRKIFDLPWVEVEIADPESVIASKYRFKRLKDQALIRTYLEYFPQKKEAIQKKAQGA